MRIVNSVFDDEVLSTTVGDRLEVHALYDGAVVAPNLDVTGWQIDWDASREVQGQATFTVTDPTGALVPWSLADPLGPGGSRLDVTWVSGVTGLRVGLGTWRIRSATPTEQWRWLTVGGESRIIPSGARVVLTADEETSTIALTRLDAEDPTASTCVAEITRLLSDICSVVVDAGVTDKAIPSGLVYDDSRTAAVALLLSVLGATHRMGGDGSFEIVPAVGVGPVWTIAGGEDGALIMPARSLSDEGVYNMVVASGSTVSGDPIVGRAPIVSGPLRVDGPFGRVPLFKNSVAKTQAAIDLDATSTLATWQAQGEVDLAVECLAHPGLQVNDRVTVLPPSVAGEMTLVGRVVAMTLRAAVSDEGVTPMKSMTIVVRVAASDLDVIALAVQRAR